MPCSPVLLATPATSAPGLPSHSLGAGELPPADRFPRDQTQQEVGRSGARGLGEDPSKSKLQRCSDDTNGPPLLGSLASLELNRTEPRGHPDTVTRCLLFRCAQSSRGYCPWSVGQGSPTINSVICSRLQFGRDPRASCPGRHEVPNRQGPDGGFCLTALPVARPPESLGKTLHELRSRCRHSYTIAKETP